MSDSSSSRNGQSVAKTREERQRVIREMKLRFIADRFKYKECICYVPKPGAKVQPGEDPRCYCGEDEKNHISLPDAHAKPPPDAKWTTDTHIISLKPTNAYGQIEFLTESSTQFRPVEFVRMADDDAVEDVMTLMVNFWGMMKPRKPSLCISVIGGAKNFNLEGRKKEVFHHGLIKAAQTTAAWIVTSGLNLGIVRVVGDALREGQTYHYDRRKMSHQIHCLGIAPWGYVLNRNLLVSEDHYHPRYYRVSTVIKSGHPVSLNENHTHYIFVDEGKRRQYGGSASAIFRAKLERRIAMRPEEGGWGIPVVLVIVEGGYDVFIDAHNSIKERVPVVICCGTGRAADVLHQAFLFREKHAESNFQFTEAEAERLTSHIRPFTSEEKLSQAITMITEIVRDPQLITASDISKTDDLDLAILYALMKTSSNIVTQLRLALAWNRSDIAAEKIFQSDLAIDPNTLESIMYQALIDDKPEFVRILLENGLIMREFLTIRRLHLIYNEAHRQDSLLRSLEYHKIPRASLPDMLSTAADNADDIQFTMHAISEGRDVIDVRATADLENVEGGLTSIPSHTESALRLAAQQTRHRSVSKSPIHLSMIRLLIEKIVGQFENHQYEDDSPSNRNIGKQKKRKFPHPFHELFLWAVLHERQALALLFWERCTDAITLALVACTLYGDMIKSLPSYDTETQQRYEGHIDRFEKLAIRVLEEGNDVDQETTQRLINRTVRTWGDMNCLKLAFKASRQRFISTVACQNSLHFAWCRGIQTNNFYHILTLICPLLLFSDRLLVFKKGLYEPNEPWTKMETLAKPIQLSNELNKQTNLSEFTPQTWDKFSEDEDNENADPAESEIQTQDFCWKFKTLYSAPKSKFISNSAIYIGFLLFFSYALLFEIVRQPLSICEIVVMVYFGALFIECVRQICFMRGGPLTKLTAWWTNVPWARLDLLVVFLAFLSFTLRVVPADTFVVAKTLYAFTLITCYMRVFRIYAVHSKLGPKLAMIQRMLHELIVFIFILFVVLLSYGVAVQTLLYPHRSAFSWSTIRDTVYYPYWNLFGELFLDLASAQKDNCTGVSDGDNCPQFNFVVPLLLAIYLLIAGILLINLLIAIFSNVFQQVEDISIQVWKFNMYSLLEEFKVVSVLPVPLSVFEAIYQLFEFLVKKCQQRDPGGHVISALVLSSSRPHRVLHGLAPDHRVSTTSSKEILLMQLIEDNITEKIVLTSSERFEVNCQRTVLQNELENDQQLGSTGINDIRQRLDALSRNVDAIAADLKFLARSTGTGPISEQPMISYKQEDLLAPQSKAERQKLSSKPDQTSFRTRRTDTSPSVMPTLSDVSAHPLIRTQPRLAWIDDAGQEPQVVQHLPQDDPSLRNRIFSGSRSAPDSS